jgi:hypothetical protein
MGLRRTCPGVYEDPVTVAAPNDHVILELRAKQDITEVIYRYCRALDRMDRPLLATVWHSDANVDYRPLFAGSAEDWIEWVWNRSVQLYRHSHHMSNVLISVDGDRAVSETYALVTIRMNRDPETFVDTVSHNRYLDRWSRRQGRWALDYRKMVTDSRVTLEQPNNEQTAGSPESQRDPSDPSFEVLRGFRW